MGFKCFKKLIKKVLEILLLLGIKNYFTYYGKYKGIFSQDFKRSLIFHTHRNTRKKHWNKNLMIQKMSSIIEVQCSFERKNLQRKP